MIYLYIVLMKNHLGNKNICKKLIKDGHIKVNDHIVIEPKYPIEDSDIIKYQDRVLNSYPFVYYMFNKPKGYISANKDELPCVMDFFEEKDLSIIGRLDKDTTGLMILTNDKSLVKKLTLPMNHYPKTYLIETAKPLKKEYIELFSRGIVIDKDVICLSSELEIIDDYHCKLTIYEGKYHQIKKMFLSLNNLVISLKRIRISSIMLDEQLAYGNKRLLTKEEVKLLKDE